MLRLTEILTPLYLIAAVMITFVVMSGQRGSTIRDPRFPSVIVRLIVYPAIVLFLLVGSLITAGTILGQGVWWGLPVAFVVGIIGLAAAAKIGAVMVGNIANILRNPPK